MSTCSEFRYDDIAIARTIPIANNCVDLLYLKPPKFDQQLDIVLEIIRSGIEIRDVIWN